VFVIRGRFALYHNPGEGLPWIVRALGDEHTAAGDELFAAELVFRGAVVRRSHYRFPAADVFPSWWLECVGAVMINSHGVALLSALMPGE
jgi:hypothetical protein